MFYLFSRYLIYQDMFNVLDVLGVKDMLNMLEDVFLDHLSIMYIQDV
jgi:hypothetical protein